MQANGCDDFVSKPVRVDELLAKVAQHLGLPLRSVDLEPALAATAIEARLPEALLMELRSAVALGDVAAMRAALLPLRGGGAEMLILVHHVERLLDNFDLDAVRDLVAGDTTSA